MTTATVTHDLASGAATAKGSGVFTALFASVKRRRDARRVYGELSRLSDRELADIGIARADIGRIAAGTL